MRRLVAGQLPSRAVLLRQVDILINQLLVDIVGNPYNQSLAGVRSAVAGETRWRLALQGPAKRYQHQWRTPMTVSVHRLRPATSLANEPVEGFSTPSDRVVFIEAAAKKVAELFDVLHIDHRNDHNTCETPQRVAKMLVEEVMRGRFDAPPSITEFDNAQGFDQLIVTGPIDLRSTCAHHLMPIYGHVIIGALPSAEGKIIGLSKYDRIVDYFASRLQIQEELVKQIGAFILDVTAPRGLAVRISAVHMCKTHRGVRAGHRSRMVSTAYYGALADDPSLKAEFIQECIGLERAASC
jgi:GTP cyclohydrolase I